VTEKITEFTENGILDESGKEEIFDCVIYATGFETKYFIRPLEIYGINKKRIFSDKI
jgi:hypothetical protein